MKAPNTILGMAAALALSTGTVAFAQVGGPDPETISPPVPADSTNQNDRNANQNQDQNRDRTNQPGAADVSGNRGTTGQPGTHSGMNTAPTASSDQSIQQQLQQLQTSPDQAPQKLFILHHGMMNQWEIELSDAVMNKTQDPQIKQLAQTTKQDHQKAQQQLKQVAQKHNLTLSDELPAMKQQELAVLKQLPADKLDQCFLSMQKVGHAAAITSLSEHQHMLKDGKNAELKAYVDQTLPVLKQHANRIVEVAQSKGMSGDITTIAAGGTGNDAETGTTAANSEMNRDRNEAGQDIQPMPPKARDGALRGNPGEVAGEQRE